MGGIKDALKIIEKTPEEIEQIKADVKKAGLPEEAVTVIIYGLNLILWLPKLILEQKLSIFRLKELLFGKSKRRRKEKESDADKADEPEPADEQESEQENNSAANDEELANMAGDIENTQNSGRTGRLPHTAYPDAIEHQVTIEGLNAGDDCPMDCGGKLYDFRPSEIIRIKGNQSACAHRYRLEKLRCNLCGEIITAEQPVDMGDEKYDAAFIAQLAIQKYYIGVPSLRQDTFHGFLHLPLPHTTQWYLLEKMAGFLMPIFSELCFIAANHELLYYDDTALKIVDEIYENRINPDKKRKGMFTTGVLARFNDYQIILYFNGTAHAGENLDKLLSKRTSTKPLMLMSDALSRNTPKYKYIIQCYCLSHAFRKFEELLSFYTKPCEKIVNLISKVYKVDKKTVGMTKAERLSYHQKHSQPLMDELHAYLNYLIDEKLAEPNDSLGKAINYTLKHWHELSQFLRIEGAPLDNNAMEQGLKIPIRGRKNWLFYKNSYGAHIGGVITSVIYTAMLSGINPQHYLVALQAHKEQVIKEPQNFLPWNYQQTLSAPLAAAA